MNNENLFKKLPDIIPLYNRDNNKVTLHKHNGYYTLCLEQTSYMRICPSEKPSDAVYEYFDWVDPSGGPMLSIGYEIQPNIVITQLRAVKNSNYINIEIVIDEKNNG